MPKTNNTKIKSAKRPATSQPRRFQPANRWLSPLRLVNFMLAFAIIGVLFLFFSQAAPIAGMYGSVEQDQVNRINGARAANGQYALQHIECLNSVAEAWTQKMANSGVLGHNPNVGNEITSQCGNGWTIIAENVGYGYGSDTLFSAFMGSTGHRDNILRGTETKVGVGAYWSNAGRLWVTHVFAGCGSCIGTWGVPATLPSDPIVSSSSGTSGSRQHTVGDYNGDGKSDLAVYRPSEKNWYVNGVSTTNWGTAGDIPVPGDYNGDGKTDVAMWRPSDGFWYVKDQPGGYWGTAGDIPVPGDYNGDGKTDMAIYRPSTKTWWINGVGTAYWGEPSDILAPGDYNGDGKTDVAIWRPSEGVWYVKDQFNAGWGLPGDVPVPGDYNGDGKTDLAIYRPSEKNWYINGVGTSNWGLPGDVPVPGDYNGDGKTDVAMWRPSDGVWYVKDQFNAQWGWSSDVPLNPPYAIRSRL